ncbi:MAG: threonylcarbamoyl-AMP synthase [Firmicutes bacterium]|nr:threonylcarbamoyl-AMP synthase [Bacillota bacterium]
MIIKPEGLLKQDLTGKIIVFPTDTVYGVGCLLKDEASMKRIFELKKREETKPMAILAGNLFDLYPLVQNVEDVIPYAKKYWPGALTLVLKKSSNVSDIATAFQNTVGIRIPNHQDALIILNHFGPMVVTSLNLSSEPAILKFEDVLRFKDKVDYIIDGGNLNGISSTVYDIINRKILRQGNVIIQD